MSFGRKIDRRLFLRGLGATVALPLLDAMIPAMARASAKPKPLRLAFIYAPNGMMMEHWTPLVPSSVCPIPEVLPSLTRVLYSHRSDILLLDSLANDQAARLPEDTGGDHARALSAYLTGVRPHRTLGKDIRAGATADQIAAAHVGKLTRLPSLELTCEVGLQAGVCDAEYTCAYTNNMSWRTPTTPCPPEVSPREVFERLFGAPDPETDPARRAAARKMRGGILDSVGSDAKRLESTLGAADRIKLEEYLYALREIEKRVEKTEVVAPPFAAPSAQIPELFRDHARLMADLIVAAFRTDSTRVVTWMLGFEASVRCYPEIGVAEAHHSVSHHRGDPEKKAKIVKINTLHLETFAYLLDQLKSIRDEDGSLLDHSMIVFGSGLSDGNRHLYDHVPTVVAGRGNGTLRPGRYIDYKTDTPIANLWVSLLDRMGVPEAKIGDSTGLLSGLNG